MRIQSIAAFLLMLSVCAAAHADKTPLALATPFGNHMLLQRDLPVNVWGSAAAGTEVSVKIAGIQTKATAGADGKWLATLPALPAGGPHILHVRNGDESIDIN